MTYRHLIPSLLRRYPDQRTQIRRRDDLARDSIPTTIILLVPVRRLTQIPAILARVRAILVPRLTRLVPDANLDVAEAPRHHRHGV